MQRTIKGLFDFAMSAKDGELGEVTDVYFDDVGRRDRSLHRQHRLDLRDVEDFTVDP